MRRYETTVRTDGTFAIQGPDDELLDVGEFESIVDTLGEEYSVEYDIDTRAYPWLETEDDVLTIDVRPTLKEISFNDEFVTLLADVPTNNRESVFIDMLRAIWDARGNLDDLSQAL